MAGTNTCKLKTAHIPTTTTKLNDTQCNCKQPSHCPLNGKCLYKDVIYQATVTRHDNNSSQSYIGLCSTTFKTRFNNHKDSFLHADKANNTQLSRHFWNLRDNNTKLISLKWNILKICKSYSNLTNRCNLCSYKKYVILKQPELSSLRAFQT